MSADSDGDGHSDYEEHFDPDYDPLVYEERYDPMEMGREFLLGAVLGEWGADEHDDIFYLGGWIASGVVVLGDVRDIAATISRGDLVGTGTNIAALIPGYGDISPAELCHLNPQKEVNAGRYPLLAEIFGMISSVILFLQVVIELRSQVNPCEERRDHDHKPYTKPHPDADHALPGGI